MKYLSIIFTTILAIGCSPIKSYTLTEMTDSYRSNFTAIDLNNYDFYKSERYYKNSENVIIKDDVDKLSDPDKTRYELQIVLIEKASGLGQSKKVIFFSCYPPYQWKGKNIYDHSFYDDHSIFNIEAINYIMFGQATGNKIIFKRNGYDSVWSFQIDDKKITISDVQFKNNGKIVNVSTDVLGNIPTYKFMSYPKILLQQDVCKPVSTTNTDFLKNHTIYYDNQCNELYFHFDGPLNINDNKEWIYFKSNRILSKLQK